MAEISEARKYLRDHQKELALVSKLLDNFGFRGLLARTQALRWLNMLAPYGDMPATRYVSSNVYAQAREQVEEWLNSLQGRYGFSVENYVESHWAFSEIVVLLRIMSEDERYVPAYILPSDELMDALATAHFEKYQSEVDEQFGR